MYSLGRSEGKAERLSAVHFKSSQHLSKKVAVNLVRASLRDSPNDDAVFDCVLVLGLNPRTAAGFPLSLKLEVTLLRSDC